MKLKASTVGRWYLGLLGTAALCLCLRMNWTATLQICGLIFLTATVYAAVYAAAGMLDK